MAISVFTPKLDEEILKLRRKLGDIYDESGNQIVLDTSPGAGQIYVGNPALISTFKSSELLDCYNSACVRFLDYLESVLPKKSWEKYIRVKYAREIVITNIDGERAIFLTDVSPSIWRIQDLAIDADGDSSLGVEISPSEYFSHKKGFVKTRSTQLLYTLMSGVDDDNDGIFLLNSGTTITASFTYFAQHTDFIHNSDGDVTIYTPQTLERIRVIAEGLAQRYRSVETRDLPEVDERSLIQQDLISIQKEAK